MEYEEYLAKANSGAFQAASPGPPSGKTIAGKRGVNITTLLKRLPEGIGYVPVLSREILLWRAAYLASLGACLWVMRAGARHLLWCILGSQGAKHAALASCGVAGKPC